MRQIGVVFGQRTQLWWDLPVIESFELLRDIYRVAPAAYASSRDELVEMLSLGDLLDVPVRQLSLGQRMRADLAAALLHSPQISLPRRAYQLVGCVSKLAVRQFGTPEPRARSRDPHQHDMDDIEALCTRVMLINKGHLLYSGR